MSSSSWCPPASASSSRTAWTVSPRLALSSFTTEYSYLSGYRALIHRPYYRLFILTLSNILVRVPQPFWLIILVNHTVSFNLFNTLVRLFPLVLQPFNRLFLSTLSNLSLSTSKKLNFIHISPVIVLVLQPL